jgi:hypothetical protein
MEAENISTDLTSDEMEQARESVERGAALLDKIEPGWELKIDLAELNLSSSCRCVLGQLYGEYEEGCEILFDTNPAYDDNAGQVMTYGFVVTGRWSRFVDVSFNLTTQWMSNYYGLLDELWIEQVKRRFDEGVTL